MQPAMSQDATHSSEVEPIDIQRLLVWYYENVDPGRPHIRSRGYEGSRPSLVASAGL